MFILNVSLICLSLKYLRKNYESISNISKWIYFELIKLNYAESKFIKSLNNKDFEVIKVLITFNENIELLSEHLVEYCLYKENYFDIVKLLIDNGANIHARDNEALRQASHNGNLEIVKLLIDNGANIHVNNNEALRWASHNGNLEIVKLLINNGANIHVVDDFALRWASHKGHLEIVKLLVDNGANIHANDNEALRYASEYGHVQIVNFLKSLN